MKNKQNTDTESDSEPTSGRVQRLVRCIISYIPYTRARNRRVFAKKMRMGITKCLRDYPPSSGTPINTEETMDTCSDLFDNFIMNPAKQEKKWKAINRPPEGFWCKRCCKYEHGASSWCEDASWDDMLELVVTCRLCRNYLGSYKIMNSLPNVERTRR